MTGGYSRGTRVRVHAAWALLIGLFFFAAPLDAQFIQRDPSWTFEREIGFNFGTPRGEILARLDTVKWGKYAVLDTVHMTLLSEIERKHLRKRMAFIYDTSFPSSRTGEPAFRYAFYSRFLGEQAGYITFYFERGYLTAVRITQFEEELPRGFADILLQFLAERSVEMHRPTAGDREAVWFFRYADDTLAWFEKNPARKCYSLLFQKMEPQEEEGTEDDTDVG